MRDPDAYLRGLLAADPNRREALTWLRRQDDKERAIGDSSEDMDGATSLRFVEDLYARGAVEVIAIDVDTEDVVETTSTLIVQMPDGAAARKRLLQVEARIARRGGFDPVGDVGQHYFMLHW